MTETARDRPRDRLRELLDAVLDDEHRSLDEMAGGAFASPYHFTRRLSREAGEPPVAMRRRVMLERARGVPDERYREPLRPSQVVLWFDGEEASLAQVLERLVFTKEIWLAAVLGEEPPTDDRTDPAGLLERQDATAGRWLAMLRDVERRGAWDDRIVDALCEPPESFVLGSIVAHVITFSAHRRQLARQLLRELGVETDTGDPIEWLRERVR